MLRQIALIEADGEESLASFVAASALTASEGVFKRLPFLIIWRQFHWMSSMQLARNQVITIPHPQTILATHSHAF
jgi:hypothetical protein